MEGRRHTSYDGYSDAEIDQLASPLRTPRPSPCRADQLLTDEPAALLERFPGLDWDGWRRFRDDYQAGKMFVSDIERIPHPFDDIIHELSSPSFLDFLERVCGESNLIPDPYLEGGGLHFTGAGGTLAPHTDFHVYQRLGLYRRVNVLVYLNPGWQAEDGGRLELYKKGDAQPSVLVVPSWGTCVIFRTDDQSVHGFSEPVGNDAQSRRSIALYYYASTEQAVYAGDVTTYWQQHGEHRGLARLRMSAYRSLLFCARAFAFFAHRANPNIGSRGKPR